MYDFNDVLKTKRSVEKTKNDARYYVTLCNGNPDNPMDVKRCAKIRELVDVIRGLYVDENRIKPSAPDALLQLMIEKINNVSNDIE